MLGRQCAHFCCAARCSKAYLLCLEGNQLLAVGGSIPAATANNSKVGWDIHIHQLLWVMGLGAA